MQVERLLTRTLAGYVALSVAAQAASFAFVSRMGMPVQVFYLLLLYRIQIHDLTRG